MCLGTRGEEEDRGQEPCQKDLLKNENFDFFTMVVIVPVVILDALRILLDSQWWGRVTRWCRDASPLAYDQDHTGHSAALAL